MAGLNALDGSVIIVLIVALVVWIGLGIFALVRTAQMRGDIANISALNHVFEGMLRTDRRFPIWVWKNGRVQAGGNVLMFLHLEGPIETLDQLVGEGTLESGGLGEHVVSEVRKCLANGTILKSAILLERSYAKTCFSVDVQHLEAAGEQWPSVLIWLEETPWAAGKRLVAGDGISNVSPRFYNQAITDVFASIDNLPFPYWVRDENLNLIDVNQAYVDAVEGESADSVIDAGTELFERSSATAARRASENQTVLRDRQFGIVAGQRRAFTVTHVPMERRRVMGIAIDVTGEEEALSELSRVLESQSETLNRLRSPVAIFGKHQTLRFYNNAFTRLTHLPEDVLARDIKHSELLDALRAQRRLPEQVDFPAWKSSILDLYQELMEPVEDMWHLPDGTAHRVVTQPHPLGGLIILFEDVTDKLALERSYNTLIAVQKETLDNMAEAVAVFGSDSKLRLCNPAFVKLWDFEELDVIVDLHLNDLLSKSPVFDGENLKNSEAKKFRQHLPGWISNRQVRTGRWIRSDDRVIEYSLVPLPDGGVMLTQNDVTDSYRIEQALRERSRALETADRLKSEFITSMSYELRTPLNSIIGFTEMLEQQIFGAVNEQQKEYLGNILEASGQLKDMISTVLDLAVIEAGEMLLEDDNISVNELVQEATDLAEDFSRRYNVSVSSNLEQAGDIVGDHRRLKQSVYNMVSTIASLTRASGEVTLALSGSDDHITLEIYNSECGLPPRELAEMIETLEMGGVPQGRRGSGLGLALVRSIIDLHGGTVSLSQKGEEAMQLICTIPRRPSQNTQAMS